VRVSRSSAWRWFLALYVPLSVVYFAVPVPMSRVLSYGAAGSAPVLAVLVGVWWHRPARRLPWLLFAVGLASFITGDLIFYAHDYLLDSELPVPSVADAFYLSMYPCLVVGLLLLGRGRHLLADRIGLVDVMIIAVGAGVLSWGFLMAPYIHDPTLSHAEMVTELAYPFADVILLTVAARWWIGGGRRNTALVLLTGGMVPLLLADTLFVLLQLGGGWKLPSPVDTGWLAFYGCFGAAALHPSMREAAEPGAIDGGRITRFRFGVLLGFAALLSPVVLAIQTVRKQPIDTAVLVSGSVVLFALVLYRVGRLVGMLERLYRAQGAEDAAREHRRRLLEAQRIARVGNWGWDRAGDRIDGSEEFHRLLGLDPGAVLHAGSEGHQAFRALIAEIADTAAARTVDLRVLGADGAERTLSCTGEGRRDSSGRVVAVVGTCQDITERKRLEEQLTHQAFHDDLTGLANRALFVDRLEHAMLRRGLGGAAQLAVLLLDLDDFKDLNDSFGHGVGDELLRAVADRLGVVRAADTLARLGGDEFALLLDGPVEPAVVTEVAERLMGALRAPFQLEGREFQLAASIGIAVSNPDRAERPADLLRNADLAMHHAKRLGKGRCEYFTPGMHSSVVRKLELIADLRRAVGAGEFTAYYQPIVEIGTARMVAVEALVRWRHPDRGVVGPLEFIPQAEESGLIVPIGRAVLEIACAQTARWRRDHPANPITVNVNLSVRQIGEPNLIDDLRALLASTRLPAGALTLEITESALADERADIAQRLWAIRRLGIRLAIDDFGTGYSSLSRLRDLPIDSLKIPKEFVDGIALGAEASAMARAIIDLAAALNLPVVAEGIEDPAQWHDLGRLGCERGQGFYFGRPVPAEEVPSLLDRALLAQPAEGR
jgi:diguanylate cyclase (GGDEF)-like protein/PAS domain S-box-containing protein